MNKIPQNISRDVDIDIKKALHIEGYEFALSQENDLWFNNGSKTFFAGALKEDDIFWDACNEFLKGYKN